MNVQLDDTITVKQAAEILGVTVRTVHNFLAAELLTPVGQLPGATGSKLLHRSQVETLAAARAKARAKK
jgi:DNA-binding transcriptional MerR regulator